MFVLECGLSTFFLEGGQLKFIFLLSFLPNRYHKDYSKFYVRLIPSFTIYTGYRRYCCNLLTRFLLFFLAAVDKSIN